MTEPVVDDVRVLGHEMLSWTDSTTVRSAATVLLYEALLPPDLGPGSTVLVVGPHAGRLVEHLVERVARVDVVIRSWPDAQDLAALDLGASLTVYCAGWDRFVAHDETYDCIVALDGLGRIFGPDSTFTPWQETVAQLSAKLAPRGELVLGVENTLGLQGLWSLEASQALVGDAEWPLPEGVEVSPTNLDGIRDELAPTSFNFESRALYPHVRRPTVAVSPQLLRGGVSDERLARLLAESFIAEDSVIQRDPQVTISEVLKHGLGLEMAPGWSVHITPADASSPEEARASIVYGEAVHGEFFGTAARVDVSGEGIWKRENLTKSVEGSLRKAGALQRDVALLEGVMPGGRTLEQHLLRACRAHDFARLRQHVRTYLAWLQEHALEQDWQSPWSAGDTERTTVVDGSTAFAHLENTVLDGSDLVVVDRSWRFDFAVPTDVAFVWNLRRFAERLIAAGAEHPWSKGSSPQALADTLAALAGLEVDDRTKQRSFALDAEVNGPPSPWTAPDHDHETTAAAIRARTPLSPMGYQAQAELQHALAVAGEQLQETQLQIDFLIGRLVMTNRKNHALRKKVKMLQSERSRLRTAVRRVRSSRLPMVGVARTRSSATAAGPRWQKPEEPPFAAQAQELRDGLPRLTPEMREGTDRGTSQDLTDG